ncbi:MAG TPA: flagellar biosynthetic protein FliO, partial [bacterium]|nr:flagellar biosynthetic protein FliO [bacterium]
IGSQAKGEPGVDRAIDEVRRQMQQTTDLRDDATDSATTVANKGIPSLFSVIVRLAYALIIVVGFLAAGLYFLRRFFSTRLPGSSRYMQVISRMALSQRSSLHLVRVLNRRLLIGEGPEGVRLIAEIPESDEAIAVKGDEPTSRPMKRAEFRDHLEREAKAVQQETFPDRLQGAVRLCREYIGRFRRGSGDA